MSAANKKDTDARLSADTSPGTVDLKKRARLINNVPLFLVLACALVVSATLALVALNRENSGSAPGDAAGGRNALALARNLVGQAGGGVVEAKTEAPPPTPQRVVPAIVPDAVRNVERPPAPPPKKSEPPAMSEEARKVRERRLRQMEAVIDAPIKAQIENMKVEPRSPDTEIARVEQQLAALGSAGDDDYAGRLAAARAAIDAGAGVPGSGGAQPLRTYPVIKREHLLPLAAMLLRCRSAPMSRIALSRCLAS